MSGRRRTLFEDANFVLDRMEHDVGVQAIPETVTEGVQATAGAPKHGATQYEPLEMVPEEVKSHLSDGALGDFLKRVDGLMEAGGSSIQFTSHKPHHCFKPQYTTCKNPPCVCIHAHACQ